MVQVGILTISTYDEHYNIEALIIYSQKIISVNTATVM